jgi:iron complex transport system substrate-binding protein
VTTVTPHRVVSLVPNGTEILFAIGAGSVVVGVSHECDYPPAARRLPILTGSALAPGMAAAAIDAAVSAQLATGDSLYTINEALVASLAPDLVVTQRLCPVCAVSTAQVEGALRPLAHCPEVLWLDPRTLAEVWEDIDRVGRATGRVAAAQAVRASLGRRLATVAANTAGRRRPRVLALEWLDPPFGGGHWVPEMIAAAGGCDALGRQPGDPSLRLTWDQVMAAEPDIVLAMPCGYDAAGSASQIALVAGQPAWQALRRACGGRIYPLDANGCFSRPGPRLVDGIEQLAALFHPPALASGAEPLNSGETN